MAGAPTVGATAGVVTVDMVGVGMVSVTNEAMEPVLLGTGVLVLGCALGCCGAGCGKGSSAAFLALDSFSWSWRSCE